MGTKTSLLQQMVRIYSLKVHVKGFSRINVCIHYWHNLSLVHNMLTIFLNQSDYSCNLCARLWLKGQHKVETTILMFINKSLPLLYEVHFYSFFTIFCCSRKNLLNWSVSPLIWRPKEKITNNNWEGTPFASCNDY